MVSFFKKKLILVGSRRNLSDIVHTANDNGYKVVGILDEHYWGNTDSIDGVPVIGSEKELLDPLSKWRKYNFFPANFWNGSQDLSGKGRDGGALRLERINVLEQSKVNVVNLIHPSAMFFHGKKSVQLGRGNLILGHARFTSRIQIGNYCIIDWDCNIGTDTNIGNNVIVGVGTTTSHANIHNNARIGTHCILISRKTDYVTVGENSVVYLGSTVLKDVPANSVYTMHHRIRSRVKQVG